MYLVIGPQRTKNIAAEFLAASHLQLHTYYQEMIHFKYGVHVSFMEYYNQSVSINIYTGNKYNFLILNLLRWLFIGK